MLLEGKGRRRGNRRRDNRRKDGTKGARELERGRGEAGRRDGKSLGKRRVTGALRRMYGKVRVQVVVELPASFSLGIRLPFDCLEKEELTVLGSHYRASSGAFPGQF